MKPFFNVAAQGDLVIIRRTAIPGGYTPVGPEGNMHVIAHSETGHNHVMVADKVRAFAPTKPDIYTLFLQVDEPTEITHFRADQAGHLYPVSPGGRTDRNHSPSRLRHARTVVGASWHF
jgi:hypothetical protein